MSVRRLSILYVTETLYRGGTEGHLAYVAPAMQAAGWDVSIFCMSEVGPLAEDLERQGVSVIGPPIRQMSKRSILYPLRVSFSSLKLLWILLRKRPPIVHFFLPGPYIVGAPLALITRTPVRLMSRRSLNCYQRSWTLARRIEPILHRRMTAILANSKSIARELVEDEGCDPSRVGLVYNGVELGRYRSADAVELETTTECMRPALVLVTVANLIPYKGHADLFEALAGIAEQLPQPWRLLCVGRDAGIGQSLREQVRRLGLDRNVVFLGERSDVASLLKASDIALLCSHKEGFANAILEAMAACLPVVATDVGGNAEAIADGATGLIVPPRDPKRLGAAILALAADEPKRSAMGARGRARAGELFSLDTCLAHYDRLYRALSRRQPLAMLGDICVAGRPETGSRRN